ncbi:N-formylglutamate amidohydrolase [Roseimaritima sediminicola]|uniref:N-formylglutamate amidohydrolase n=1 Tax=Roseimaritima sediminicola TaxID=2662066 RepID=UPI001298431D|nr:N-formylglutamate amidohydrolase [Roseimaritima sediminicola]
MTLMPHCIFQRGTGPIVAAAVHDGHDMRPRLEDRMAIDEEERLREEDPHTGELTQVAKTQIVGLRSRFEVDLNRPRDEAVYIEPEDAWGLKLWRRPPTKEMIEKSLSEYDEFYASVETLLRELLDRYGHVVVYDLHSYNHRREGADAPAANPLENPDVNVGTGTMEREYWAPVVDRFIQDLRQHEYHGRTLDVRENVRFQGGHFSRWIHKTFPRQVCSLAIEFKKTFMDEWTGQTDPSEIETIFDVLQSTIPGVREELENL